MQEHELIALAAPPALAVIRAIRPDQYALPTPCSDFDVRALIGHLRQWAPVLESTARKQPPGQPDDAGLEEQIDRLVAAWSEPAAWEGTASMGGPEELPARMIGAMAIGEIVVHGWDLARATGQEVSWDAALLELLLDEVAKTAAMGREMHVYADEVPVPETAPTLDRMLGLTGRDPAWTP
jgi:uncharacterized protein (TIGR03086 family)